MAQVGRAQYAFPPKVRAPFKSPPDGLGWGRPWLFNGRTASFKGLGTLLSLSSEPLRARPIRLLVLICCFLGELGKEQSPRMYAAMPMMGLRNLASNPTPGV